MNQRRLCFIGELQRSKKAKAENIALQWQVSNKMQNAILLIYRVRTLSPLGAQLLQPKESHLTDNMGRNPNVGESIEKFGYRFELVDLNRQRIDKILIARIDNPYERL